MLYRFGYHLFRLLFRFFGQLRTEGLENVPASGGVILAPNHVSYADPPLVGTALAFRPTWYMAKQELFEVPVLGALIRRCRAFPVRRGTADRQALRRATELLEAGEVVTIFPEGGRSPDGGLQPPELGFAAIARRSGAPVVPVAVIGSDRLLPRGAILPRFRPVLVRFGRPLCYAADSSARSRKEDLQAFAATVMAAIERLRQVEP